MFENKYMMVVHLKAKDDIYHPSVYKEVIASAVIQLARLLPKEEYEPLLDNKILLLEFYTNVVSNLSYCMSVELRDDLKFSITEQKDSFNIKRMEFEDFWANYMK